MSGRWTSAASARTTARPSYTLKRAKEVYETYYDIRYPGHERLAGRPLRVSSAYSLARASTTPRSARSPAGSGSTGTTPTPPSGDESLRPRGWAGMHWSPAIGAEHRATREAAGLFDESSFAKLEVSGPGAADLLERLCDNAVARDIGAITYTQMLNRRGGIECDFTVTRVSQDVFAIVTGTAFGNHDASWIRSHLPDDGSVRLSDVTARWACFGLWGPRAHEILSLADAGSARLRLHVDARDRRRRRAGPRAPGDVRRANSAGSCTARPSTAPACGGRCGRPASLMACVPCGYRAIDSLRLEKGYRVWAADITPDETPYRSRARASACARTRRSSALTRCAPASPSGGCAASCSRTRARWRSATSRSGSTATVRGRVTSGGYGYTVAALDRLRLPPGRRRDRRPRSRSTSSGSGSPACSPASRCSTRGASASGRLSSGRRNHGSGNVGRTVCSRA